MIIRWIFMHTLMLMLLRAVIVPDEAVAETVVRGRVVDAESGESLPAAFVRVAGTRHGNIANDEGSFAIDTGGQAATLVISHIGYRTVRVNVDPGNPDAIDVALEPAPVLMPTVVVPAGDRGPGIMQRVIERKREWYPDIEAWEAEAYTRVVMSNDTTIVSISESLSTLYWSRGKGFREVIRTKRQTENTDNDGNFASARMTPNLYDDDVDVLGNDVVGVTHPDALDYYTFTLEGIRYMDNRKVFDISVVPNTLEPAFEGRVAVLDSVFALLEVSVRPGKMIMLPAPLNRFTFTMEQQFSDFDGRFWLPVDVRMSGSFKLKLPGLEFPLIQVRQSTRITDYDIAAALPDSIFQQGDTLIDLSGLSNPDSLFAETPDIIPFAAEEATAYSAIDSTMTFDKAYRPTGILSRVLTAKVKAENTETGQSISTDDGAEKRKPSRFSRVRKALPDVTPDVRHNRVEGWHLGAGLKETLGGDVTLTGGGAYNTGSEHWAWNASGRVRWGKKKHWRSIIAMHDAVEPRAPSATYPHILTDFITAAGARDYLDYYHARGGTWTIGHWLSKADLDIEAGIRIERHDAMAKTTDDNLLGRDRTQRPNPPIAEGDLRSVEARLRWGDEPVPLGFSGGKGIGLEAEHAVAGILGGDLSFTHVAGWADWRTETFLRRRLFPMMLDVRAVGGMVSGDAPLQRWGALDGSVLSFSTFGTFRTLWHRRIEGERYAALFWEHHFRTVPFELIGFRWAAERGLGLILHGGHGRTWIRDSRRAELPFTPLFRDDVLSEVGVSLTGLFGLFRADVTRRLNDGDIYLTAGAARIF